MIASKKQQYFSIEDITKIVEDVKKSNCFGRSKRQLKLFEYLLTKSLSGLTDDVTQYSIALDVLDRPESFDSASDSIVRVEMHRLRANLDVYNSADFNYLIELPSARFDIIVKARKRFIFTRLQAAPKSIGWGGLIATIAFMIGHASSGAPKIINKAECSELIPNVNVSYQGEAAQSQPYVEALLRGAIAQQTSFNLLQPKESCSNDSAPVFDIQYAIYENEDEFSLVLKALDKNDIVVGSHHINGDISATKNGTEFHHKIIATANSMTMPDSMLARFALKGEWSSPQNKKNYGCLIAMYDSFSGELTSEFVNIHSCLENAVESGTATLDNYGALASSYLDQARNSRHLTTTDSLKMAERILDEYKDEWINSSELAIARVYYEVGRPDFNAERMEQILTNTRLRYSTNPQVLLTVASYLGYSIGRWDDAKFLSDYVKRIYFTRDQSVYDVDAGYAFVNHSSDQPIDDCYKYYSEDSIYINVLVNACAVSAENKEWAEITEANLGKMNIEGTEDKITYIENSVQDRQFMNKIRNVFGKSVSY
ncbi:MAG: hypothetical protein ABJ275_09920 [Maricaulaceae bacterium]